MVSNYERIHIEIKIGAMQIAPENGLKPESAVRLIMEVVDLEDANRVKANNRINPKIKELIRAAAEAERHTEST